MEKKPLMLIVLDGWGIGEEYPGNAVALADTRNFNRLKEKYPYTTLQASGLAVGLPQGQMGNSEVGHLNIGAGRIVYQDLTRISKAIENGDFYSNKVLLKAINNAKEKKTKLHLLGLVSDGGVHSHIDHLYGLLDLCKRTNLTDVYIHAFLDGRDVPPAIGKDHIQALEAKIKEIGIGEIATVSGRYYAMDRDKRWERTGLAYDAIVEGRGVREIDPVDAIKKSYSKEIYDEFMVPTVIYKDHKPIATIEDKDSIIFFNFRPDRARQLTRLITERLDTCFVSMTEYDKTLENVNVAFKSVNPKNTLGEYISNLGYSQLRIAETEKYGHVTFFFNGGREEVYPNEDRVLIPSPKVATYDLKPEMSAIEVKNNVIERLNMDKYDFIVLNFANPDMVGHTGVLSAGIKAVETVDKCLGEIVDHVLEKGGKAIITADHGNAEQMIDNVTGGAFTAHTTNLVPLIIVGAGDLNLSQGVLADLAPTVLDLMGIEKPIEMTGRSLIN